MRKYVSNILHALLLVLLLYAGSQIFQALSLTASRTYHPIPKVIFSCVFPIFIGIYLAVPVFFSNIKRQGIWTIDWGRLAIQGTVSLLLALAPILYFFSPMGQLVPRLLVWLIDFIQGNTIAGVIFGYLLLSLPRKIDAIEIDGI